MTDPEFQTSFLEATTAVTLTGYFGAGPGCRRCDHALVEPCHNVLDNPERCPLGSHEWVDPTGDLTAIPEDYAAGQADTSQAAFHSTDRATMRADVLAFIKARSDVGATADEVVHKFDPTGTLTTSYAPRVTELMREGLLWRSEERRKTRKGRSAIVYKWRQP